jgi:anionic cell wall polymer biosynthesis LytR-Cps2A-Psr (LCP) family protein
LSRKVADSTLNFAANSASLAPVFTFGTAAIIASLILFYIVFKENNSVPIKEQNFELKVVKDTSSIDSNKIEILEANQKLEKKNVQVEQTIKVEPKEKTTKIISTPKDTITPKVVVIKRQIIKKDTIYVQK